MNIVFICGSLEPGRDGVGDYTRRLAAELIKDQHQAAIVAINDKHSANGYQGQQQSGGISVPVLRISAKLIPLRRYQEAALWIGSLNPEWISLQFVPFSYHQKGLSTGMGKMLFTLGKNIRWHIMVHELWVGMDKESPLKMIYWGWLQKQLMRSLFRKLNPVIIHTQSNLYLKLLTAMGFTPKYLPLFGNIIPLLTGPKKEGNETIPEKDTRQIISFVVFGGIHAGAPIVELVEELKLYSASEKVTFVLKLIGRCGPEVVRWQQEFTAAHLQVEVLGEQPPEVISKALSAATFGISTTPAALIEKSGSVAAMREHGLPVLCVSRPWHPRGVRFPEQVPGVVQYTVGGIPGFIKNNAKYAGQNNISTIASQFVANLLSA